MVGETLSTHLHRIAFNILNWKRELLSNLFKFRIKVQWTGKFRKSNQNDWIEMRSWKVTWFEMKWVRMISGLQSIWSDLVLSICPSGHVDAKLFCRHIVYASIVSLHYRLAGLTSKANYISSRLVSALVSSFGFTLDRAYLLPLDEPHWMMSMLTVGLSTKAFHSKSMIWRDSFPLHLALPFQLPD